MSNNDTQQIVNKAWNFAHVLRDDGLPRADYVSAFSQNVVFARASSSKLFEGKLVPQDPTDEPAGVLLERLRASRTVPEVKASVRKRGVKP